MSEVRTAGPVAKIFVWLWYVPIIVILAVTTYVSVERKAPAAIVDKARVFQDSEEASRPLEALTSKTYNFRLELNQDFTLNGPGVKTSGSFREGERLEFPFTLEGIPGRTVSSVRAQVLDGKDKELLKGMKLIVRSCATEWQEQPSGYVCNGASTIERSNSEITADTFAVMDAEEKLSPTDKKFLLFQVTVENNIIVPLDGYSAKLTVSSSGLTEPAKG